MVRILLLILIAVLLELFTGCVKVPRHTNPYDPETPNSAPQKLMSKPDSMISGVTRKSISLQWPMAAEIDEEDFEAYVISRKAQGEADFTVLDEITSLIRNSYTDLSVSSNTLYEYAISVRDKGGRLSPPLTVKVRSRPGFANLGQLPRYMVSQNAAGSTRRWRSKNGTADSLQTLFILGMSEKGSPMISYFNVPQIADTTSSGFVSTDFTLDGAAPQARIKPYTVNGITPLENSIFKTIMTRRDPSGPYANDSNPLGKALTAEDVLYHKLKFGALCPSTNADSLYIGLVDFFQLKPRTTLPRWPEQLGLAGVLRYIRSGQSYRYDTLFELPVADSLIRDDNDITVMEASETGPELYIAGTLTGFTLVARWNRLNNQISYLQSFFDPLRSVIRVITAGGSERVAVSTFNNIQLITSQPAVSLAPGKYLSDVISFALSSDNLVYACDAGNTGISVIDVGDLAGPGEPVLVSKWTTFGNRELNLGPSDYLFALGSVVVFTMDGTTLWRTY